MLDIGGTIKCRVYQYDSGFFQVYIKAESLGIEPGIVFLSNHRNAVGDWYIRLYANTVSRKNKNKRKKRDLKKIPEFALLNSVYHNEAIKIWWENDERWFIQDIKASILLPIIKERSKIPNGLVYKDEYWKT
jgi:hypothetical protein